MKTKNLKDLVSVGPATISDLKLLDITTINELVGQDPYALYRRLCQTTGKQHDICVLDVLCCAVAQAENPNLPDAQKQWFYWSKLRKKLD